MTSISKVDSRLSGSLVASVLKANDSVTGLELVFGEAANILGRLSGSKAGQVVVASFSGKGLETGDNRSKILTFPQVNALKLLLGRNSKITGSLEKVVDIFHALECHCAGVHPFYHARLELIDKSENGNTRKQNDWL